MKVKKISLSILLFCLTICIATCLSGCYTLPEYSDVYMTTGTMSKLLARQTSLKFENMSYDNFYGVTIDVDPSEKGQEFYGYGASLTHSSAYLLVNEGSEEVVDEMISELYGENGARLNLVRIPIGSSDYIEGENFFSCCDLDDNYDEDLTLSHFSIEKDANIITVLKKILKVNPNIKVFAAPWSAPAWMKDSKSLTMNGTLESKYYEVYADYLVKFIEAYRAEGINIDYLSLVNEPLITNIAYPHMSINELQAIEIGKYLKSKFKEKSLSTSLLAWEHNADEMAYDYMDTVFDKDVDSNLFKGVALHGYADVNLITISEATDYIKTEYGKEIFMTEITEHSGSNDFASNLSYAGRYVTIDPINYGLNGAMFWNLVLRPDGSPTPVKHNTECYGLMDIDNSSGETTYYKRSAYYATAHVSQFAYAVNGKYPVAVKAESSNDSQIMACALYRADGAVIVSAVNISDTLSETVRVRIDGKSIEVELLPQSVVTFVC